MSKWHLRRARTRLKTARAAIGGVRMSDDIGALAIELLRVLDGTIAHCSTDALQGQGRMDDDHETEGTPKTDHCRDRGCLKGEIDRARKAAWPLRGLPRCLARTFFGLFLMIPFLAAVFAVTFFAASVIGGGH
jgi:hypothetical protein